MLLRYAAASLAAAAIATGSLQAQIVNGGFETPVQPGGGYTLYNTGDTFPGWTVVGAPGNVAVIGTAYGAGHSGNQWLDMTGISNSATGIQQSIATTAGTNYTLSFWVGNSNQFGSTTSTSLVYINGVQVMTATNSQLNGSTLVWQQFFQSFTATGASTTIGFINGDPSSDSTNGLDDVSVNVQQTTTTPEPSSMALLGTGLFGLVPLARRRVRRVLG